MDYKDNKRRGIILILILFVLIISIYIVNAVSPKNFNKKTLEKNIHKINRETEIYLKNIDTNEVKKDFLIKFKNSVDEAKLSKVTLKHKNNKFKLAKINGKVKDIEELIEDNEIEFVELEQNINILEESIQFNIKNIKADSVWELSKGSGVKVAVLDTGIASHPDLNVAGGYSVVSNNYNDNNGHGTAVAGVISALVNNEGLVGVAPEIDLYAVKIMDSSNGELSDAISGLEWTIDNNMSIVSMSFGFESYSQIFKSVVEEAYNNGILLVASSGNNGKDNILYPAKYNKVIAVGAVDKENKKAPFSSYGFDMELVASGVDINSTFLNNKYNVFSGTSMSAPHVAGVAALIKAYNNSLTNIEIRNKLRNDALDLGDERWDMLYGYGLVQANLATFNFTSHNDSYYYEIFNITDYNTLLERYTFWIKDTGHVDDVYFSEGMYLVNITKFDVNQIYIYNVSENGSLTILATNVFLDDFFSTEGGTTTDGVAWLNDGITVRIDTTINPLEVECFTIDYVPPQPPSNIFDYCFSTSQSLLNECDSNEPDMRCEAGYTTCQVVSQMEAARDILDDATNHRGSVSGRAIGDCTDVGSTSQDAAGKDFYIVNKKAAQCINESDYNVVGWYGTAWITYDTDRCQEDYKCVDTKNFTSESDNVNPCIKKNICTGQVQIITEDRDGNPIKGLKVSRDDISNKTTDIVGVAQYNLTKDCGKNMVFTAYCSDNVTVCGTHTTALDQLNDFEGKLFDCSLCTDIVDLQLNIEDVSASKSNGEVKVNISILNIPTTSNVNVTFKVQSNDGLISIEKSQNFSINSGDKFKFITQSITLTEDDDFVHVYVDATNKVVENSEKNNYALVPLFEKEIDVYFDINTTYPLVDSKIKEYLKLFVNEKQSPNSAQITLCVGRKCNNFKTLNDYTLNRLSTFQKFGFNNNNKLIFNGKDVGTGRPYNGIVAGFLNFDDSRQYVMAYGNDIDGDIAAVKKLISARATLLNRDLLSDIKVRVIDDFDLTGISVADLLRHSSNFPYYNDRTNDRFATVVERILTDNNFELSVRTVKTRNDNTTLRMKNMNTDYSQNYKDGILENPQPVVLAHGIHSNLNTWQDFAEELAFDQDNARDAWLIEMYGGPTTECDTCPVYTFDDLRYYYFPALIAGVQKYTGENNLSYVGYDLGCTVALESLENYSGGLQNAGYYFDTTDGTYKFTNLNTNPIGTFVGIGCLGNFTQSNYNSKKAYPFFARIINRTNYDNLPWYYADKDHIRSNTYKTPIFSSGEALELLKSGGFESLLKAISYIVSTSDKNYLPPFTTTKLSRGVYKDMQSWIRDDSGPIVGKNVTINNVLLIQGNQLLDDDIVELGFLPSTDPRFFKNTDGFIHTKDIKQICQNINSSNKYYASFDGLFHFTSTGSKNLRKSLPDYPKSHSLIELFLRGSNLEQSKFSDNLLSINQNCEE